SPPPSEFLRLSNSSSSSLLGSLESGGLPPQTKSGLGLVPPPLPVFFFYLPHHPSEFFRLSNLFFFFILSPPQQVHSIHSEPRRCRLWQERTATFQSCFFLKKGLFC